MTARTQVHFSEHLQTAPQQHVAQFQDDRITPWNKVAQDCLAPQKSRLRQQGLPALFRRARRVEQACLAPPGVEPVTDESYRRLSTIWRATISASSPTPWRIDDFSFRMKCTPMKYRPGTLVWPSVWMGKPMSSKIGNFTQPYSGR